MKPHKPGSCPRDERAETGGTCTGGSDLRIASDLVVAGAFDFAGAQMNGLDSALEEVSLGFVMYGRSLHVICLRTKGTSPKLKCNY